MNLQKEIHFNVPKTRAWEILTNPEITKQYMFGCQVLSDWRVGSAIVWKGLTEDGQEVDYVKGEILEIEIGERVKFTIFDPNMGIEDIPENYVNLTYELEETENGTYVMLTQGDFTHVENGQKRYEEAVKGWDMVIPIMEKIT